MLYDVAVIDSVKTVFFSVVYLSTHCRQCRHSFITLSFEEHFLFLPLSLFCVMIALVLFYVLLNLGRIRATDLGQLP